MRCSVSNCVANHTIDTNFEMIQFFVVSTLGTAMFTLHTHTVSRLALNDLADSSESLNRLT